MATDFAQERMWKRAAAKKVLWVSWALPWQDLRWGGAGPASLWAALFSEAGSLFLPPNRIASPVVGHRHKGTAVLTTRSSPLWNACAWA